MESLSNRVLIVGGDGWSSLKMIRSLYSAFEPKQPIHLDQTLLNRGFTSGKESLAEMLFPPGENFCRRYEICVWEQFLQEDTNKIRHFAAHLSCMRKAIWHVMKENER